MIRWKYLSPKTIGILAIVVFIALAFGPAVRHFLITSAAAELGTRLTIGHASVSLLSTELELTGVRLAYPLGSAEDLLACQRVLVDVEGAPLLRRKLVIRNASVFGLRLLTPPVSANELANRWPLPQHWKLQRPAQQQLQASLSPVTDPIQKDPLADSSTLALLDVLISSGPQQMLEFQNDMGTYELRLERLADLAQTLSHPLRGANEKDRKPLATQTLLELKELEENVYTFRKSLDTSRKKFQADRQRLLSLKEQDLSRWSTPAELQIPKSQVLTECFLGAAASERSWDILRFVQWAREYLPRSPAATPSNQTPGLTITFPEHQPLPEFVLRALHFEGQGALAGRSFDFAGTLQNLSNHPRGFGHPIRLVVDAKVPHRVVVEALVDRTGNVPRERIVIRCPSWPQSRQTFGNTSLVGIVAKPCLLSLRAELNLSAGQVSGIVQMRQQRLELSPQVSSELGGERVQSALVEMFSQIDTIDYDVHVSGPLASPSMTLSSPWGERVAGGLQHAFEKELSLRTAACAEKLSQELDARIAAWEESATTSQQDLQTRLGTTLEQVQLLDSLVQRQLPQATEPSLSVTQRPEPAPAAPTERK